MSRKDNFTLNRDLYIGVYAQTFAVFELTFGLVYSSTYNIKTNAAKPLVDSQARYVYFTSETQEEFFSFMPWWSGQENRSFVMFAQVIFNKVFFYMKYNDFPQFYTTEWQDNNDLIALNPWDRNYNRKFGYFVRVRPDFALYDLISKR